MYIHDEQSGWQSYGAVDQCHLKARIVWEVNHEQQPLELVGLPVVPVLLGVTPPVLKFGPTLIPLA